MKNALIIVVCGIILALIIGATSQSKVITPVLKFDTCKELKESPECAYERDKAKEVLSEKFLRGIRFKVRIAYA